jgi:hypothetical protein
MCVILGLCDTQDWHMQSVEWLGYVLYYQGIMVWFLVGARQVFTPKCADYLCGPPNLLFSRYQEALSPDIWGLFKKRPNFLNSAPTSTESALWLLSKSSVRFWQQTTICLVSLWALVVKLHPLNWARARAVHLISDKEEIQENVIRELRTITESAF